jgi:tetratricopeptide (TPR) repeat protein
MVFSRLTVRFFCLFLLVIACEPSKAQLGFDLDIKKPEPYDNRKLKAEKTGTGKLKAPGRFFQNTYTHYNYFYNSNTKLNSILDRAKQSHRDNYALLLPFYNYSLEATNQDSSQLDSVIHKAKTGIVLHDLRNDWIDDLYLLWGAAYFLQQQYDSASQMFQFINHAFAEKESDGYYKYIGSNADGATSLSIVTKENEGILKRMTSDPPSRNNAFIWQIRTLIQQKAFPEAGSLIAMLKADPNFPDRLKGAIEETHALWFYSQNQWDSAARHLTAALGEAKSKQERARWEYLAAQLFERSNQLEEAKTYYTKAIGHTTDPVLDVYARLNLVRINKDASEDYVTKNIEELLKMAKRDKYEEYRDIIYAMAAQMEIERGNLSAAQQYLAKAAKYRTGNPEANNSAYLQLGNIAFDRQDYTNAAAYYDSIQIESLPPAESQQILERTTILSGLLAHLNTIERQDSLQRIAALPEEEREVLIKKMVRQLRRQQGLKEEEPAKPAAIAGPADAFAAQQPKGEWYFYNTSLKTAGITTFKQVWGNRPNVDNWRRQSEVTAQLSRNVSTNTAGTSSLVGNIDNTLASPSFESLSAQLPLTAELIKTSNDSIIRSLYGSGRIYVDQLENYPAAITAYEHLRSRFKEGYDESQVLFDLYYCYSKVGEADKAASIKNQLLSKYPNSRFASIVTTGQDPQSSKPRADITKVYEDIYDMFLEGRFTEAQEAKRNADSMYRTNYWSPQLLYIEAVYHIQQREDSVAQHRLSTLVDLYEGTPIAARASTLKEVLSRRREIEDELTKLQIERPVEEPSFVTPLQTVPTIEKKDTVVSLPTETVVQNVRRDSVKQAPVKPIAVKPKIDTTSRNVVVSKPNSLFSYNPNAEHYVAIILEKVDVVFVREANNAFNRYNKETFYSLPLETNVANINDDTKAVLIGRFSSAQGAIEYIQKTKPIAGSQIVPWLKGGKLSFSLISEANLQVVTETKEFNTYQKFLEQNLPIKF